MEIVSFNKTLEQELLALTRGVSLECLVCGEFVLRRADTLACPECGSLVRAELGTAESKLQFDLQAG
jgi:hypothetical protein